MFEQRDISSFINTKCLASRTLSVSTSLRFAALYTLTSALHALPMARCYARPVLHNKNMASGQSLLRLLHGRCTLCADDLTQNAARKRCV